MAGCCGFSFRGKIRCRAVRSVEFHECDGNGEHERPDENTKDSEVADTAQEAEEYDQRVHLHFAFHEQGTQNVVRAADHDQLKDKEYDGAHDGTCSEEINRP